MTKLQLPCGDLDPYVELLLQCKSALENNKIWTDDDKIHFDSFTLSNTKTVLMTIKTIAPKKVQEDIAFKQDYKEVMTFVELTESTS